MLYVVPITSILSQLLVVPVGEMVSIPFGMQAEVAEFPQAGASCDSRQDAGPLQAMVVDSGMQLIGNGMVS